MPVTLTRNFLLGVGLFALIAGLFSAYDATKTRPTDGAIWLLGADQVRVVGTVPGGPADQAGIRAGDFIVGIDTQPVENSPAKAARLLRSKRVGDRVSYMWEEGGTGEIVIGQLQLESTRITDLGTYLVYCGLGLIYFLAGLYLFWNNPNLLPARLFYLLCIAFLVYFFSASERSAFYYWSDIFTRNMGALASLLLPPLFLHFFLVFPRERTLLRQRPWLPWLLYLPPAYYYVEFTYLQVFGDKMASIGPLQQLTLGLYFTAGLASLVTTYITSPDATLRQRVKILTVGTVLGTLPFLVFNIALGKLLGRQDFALLGAVPMVLVPASFGYSIARYRLMDLNVIVRRSAVYVILTGLVVGTYLLVVVVVGNLLLTQSQSDRFTQRDTLVAIIATLLIAAAFQPARDRIQAFLERRFFREKHDMQRALHDLSKSIPTQIEVESLVALIRSRITALLHPTRFAFLPVVDGDLHLDGDLPARFPKCSALLKRRGTPLTPDLLAAEVARRERVAREEATPELADETEQLKTHGLEVLVPAFAGDRLVGALGLGPKRSEAAYDSNELEIVQIVAGQMAVQLENTRLYREAIERRRLEEEMALARDIQQRMLPSEVPRVAGYEIAALNLASSQVSGDYYDFLSLPNGSLGLVICDVSGKGMPASLLASNLQASIRTMAARESRPGTILAAVNSSLYESTDASRFATAFLGQLYPQDNALVYSNAGHNPPLLRCRDGSHRWLSVGGTPLGAFPAMEFPEDRISLQPGEVLVLFTDGVTEAEAEGEVLFGESRLCDVVSSLATEPAARILEGIRDAVFAHAAGEAGDDMTVIVVRAAASSDNGGGAGV